jgi:hypothetical protein
VRCCSWRCRDTDCGPPAARHLLLKPPPRLREIHGHDVSGQVHSAAALGRCPAHAIAAPGISAAPCMYDASKNSAGRATDPQVRISETNRTPLRKCNELFVWTSSFELRNATQTFHAFTNFL